MDVPRHAHKIEYESCLNSEDVLRIPIITKPSKKPDWADKRQIVAHYAYVCLLHTGVVQYIQDPTKHTDICLYNITMCGSGSGSGILYMEDACMYSPYVVYVVYLRSFVSLVRIMSSVSSTPYIQALACHTSPSFVDPLPFLCRSLWLCINQ